MDPLLAAGVALITGSGSGIGQQIAVQLAHHGCRKLFLVDISETGLQNTEAALKEVDPNISVTLHIADISKEEAVKRMVSECIGVFGRLDFACNNAGIIAGSLMTHEMDVATFERINKVNAKGVFLCHKYEVAAMLQQQPLAVPGINYLPRGSIVNTSSMAGLAVMPMIGPYSASKHGIISITRVDARQYAAEGIRINSVCPGFVETPMMKGEMSDDFIQGAAKQAPMNRTVNPSEVANAVVFLSGSLATAVTGISLPVDCGALLYHVV